MDKKLLVGNLKMYMNKMDVDNYLEVLTGKINNESIILVPSALFIPYFLNKDFSVGIQTIATAETGAYTGEISAEQAKSLDVKYAIVGHSERRIYFDEMNEEIFGKIRNLIKNNIKPILCIGETLEDYENHKTNGVLKNQMIDCLTGLTNEELESVIIAYEPIWAIGTGKIPTKDEIYTIVRMVKSYMVETFNLSNLKVLYGGSVNSNNIEELEGINNLDGYLIGSAATKTEEILKMKEVVYK